MHPNRAHTRAHPLAGPQGAAPGPGAWGGGPPHKKRLSNGAKTG
ncbi:MAG: hypothetical protein AAGF95_24715 [Chloroflexota bacterium]